MSSMTVPRQGAIALVDDDEIDRMITRRVLASSRLENPVVEFSSATEFVQHLADNADDVDISLALIDINMPGMTGFEAVPTIRATLDPSDLPILAMLTSSEAERDFTRARECGADLCLSKQAGFAKFVALIDDNLSH